MRLALRELVRRKGNFVVATVILTVIALLLLFLGGLLDGIVASSTGAFRAQQGDLIVYSASARKALVRSRITPQVRAEVAATEGVKTVGGLGSVQLGARPGTAPESRDLVATVLFGYQLAPRGLPAQPPAQGTVIADTSLQSRGVSKGDILLLGPRRSKVKVVGFVSDTRYVGQDSLWGSLATWRRVGAANRPGVGTGGTVQALVVQTAAGADANSVAGAIDRATGGATETLTRQAAIDALPGVSQQKATFSQIIGVTIVIAVIVIALFFALVTVERVALYGILKAIGASNATLVAGVVLQAVIVTLVAALIGVVAALIVNALVPAGGIPFEVIPSRLVSSVLGLLVAAVVGSAFSLRRVLRIDPASAIGAGS